MSSSKESLLSSSSELSLQRRQVPVNSFKDVRPVLQATLKQLDHPFIKKAEQLSKLDREKLFYIFASLVVLFLMVGNANMALATFIGVAYPVYATMEALSMRNASDYNQWLVYWCVFAQFSQLDPIFASSAGLLPMYLLLKTAFLLYLALPQTYGAHNLYVLYGPTLARWMEKLPKTE